MKEKDNGADNAYKSTSHVREGMRKKIVLCVNGDPEPSATRMSFVLSFFSHTQTAITREPFKQNFIQSVSRIETNVER